MRDKRTAPPGVSIIGFMPSYGVLAHGIIIDNPSGSWLFVEATADYIAPYTLGWSRALDVGLAAASVRAGDGPAGQLGTQLGDPWTVTLDSELVASSAGAPAPGAAFIPTSQEPLYQNYFDVVHSVTNTDRLLVAGIPGRRIRLLAFSSTIALLPWPVFYQLAHTAPILAPGSITLFAGDATVESLTYIANIPLNYGFLLPEGRDLWVTMVAPFDSTANSTVTWVVV